MVFKSSCRNHLPHDTFHLPDVLFSHFDARARWRLHIDDEIGRHPSGEKTERNSDERIKKETQQKDGAEDPA